MTTKSKILVTGATGKQGGAVARENREKQGLRPEGEKYGERPRRRHGQRRFPEKTVKKEGTHPAKAAARHEEKPVKMTAPHEPVTYSRAVPEAKPSESQAKTETPKEVKEKTGILKRFLKFLKKP